MRRAAAAVMTRGQRIGIGVTTIQRCQLLYRISRIEHKMHITGPSHGSSEQGDEQQAGQKTLHRNHPIRPRRRGQTGKRHEEVSKTAEKLANERKKKEAERRRQEAEQRKRELEQPQVIVIEKDNPAYWPYPVRPVKPAPPPGQRPPLVRPPVVRPPVVRPPAGRPPAPAPLPTPLPSSR